MLTAAPPRPHIPNARVIARNSRIKPLECGDLSPLFFSWHHARRRSVKRYVPSSAGPPSSTRGRLRNSRGRHLWSAATGRRFSFLGTTHDADLSSVTSRRWQGPRPLREDGYGIREGGTFGVRRLVAAFLFLALPTTPIATAGRTVVGRAPVLCARTATEDARAAPRRAKAPQSSVVWGSRWRAVRPTNPLVRVPIIPWPRDQGSSTFRSRGIPRLAAYGATTEAR